MKKMYAVVDNYNEGKFPIIAVCKTYERAEKFTLERVEEEEKAGNNYNFDIMEMEVEEELFNDGITLIQKVL